jgi:hypothetical protein
LILLHLLFFTGLPPDIAIIALCNSSEPYNLFNNIFNVLYIIALMAPKDCKMQRQAAGREETEFFLANQKINQPGPAAMHCC